MLSKDLFSILLFFIFIYPVLAVNDDTSGTLFLIFLCLIFCLIGLISLFLTCLRRCRMNQTPSHQNPDELVEKNHIHLISIYPFPPSQLNCSACDRDIRCCMFNENLQRPISIMPIKAANLALLPSYEQVKRLDAPPDYKP